MNDSARGLISKSVIEHMASGVLVADSSGEIVTVNRQANRILGSRDLLGREVSEALDFCPGLLELFQTCLSQGKPSSRREIHFPDTDGQDKILGVSVTPITGEGGTLTGALCLFSNLTEIKRIRKELRQKEVLADLGTLSAGLAHEFKNSLSTILGLTSLARRSEDPEEQEGYLSRLQNEARSLQTVVENFLDFSRPGTLLWGPVDLESMCGCLADDLSQVGFPGVRFSVRGSAPIIEGDEERLRRVFLNLIRNAAEAIEGEAGSGRVDVAIEPRERSVLVSVSDDGPGIPEEFERKIFLPFFSGKPDGTGLGLALAQKAVLDHNGRISINRSESGGARFDVLLPVQKQSGPISGSDSEQRADESSPRRGQRESEIHAGGDASESGLRDRRGRGRKSRHKETEEKPVSADTHRSETSP